MASNIIARCQVGFSEMPKSHWNQWNWSQSHWNQYLVNTQMLLHRGKQPFWWLNAIDISPAPSSLCQWLLHKIIQTFTVICLLDVLGIFMYELGRNKVSDSLVLGTWIKINHITVMSKLNIININIHTKEQHSFLIWGNKMGILAMWLLCWKKN